MPPKLHVCANFMDRRQTYLFGSRKVGCFLVLSLIFFEAWSYFGKSYGGRVAWKSSFVAIIWFVWKDRNLLCHEGNLIIATALTSKSKNFIALSIPPLFRGLQLGGGGFLTEALQVAIELSYLSFFCRSSVASL